ncbi:MAG TPA: type I methionyl aminopeptidase, partial [Candidatus Paceibacterota bacterium]|nr:type I methionyl aminopeptidase [Candidatus Paceibacterota bacterium]
DIREGGRRLARHVRILSAMVKPGAQALDIEAKARAMVEKDGDTLAFMGYPSGKHNEKFPTGLCFSVNDVIVHAPAFAYEIQEGDVVSLDFGIRHKGLYTDHAVTVIAGKGSAEDIRLVRGTYEALATGIKAAVLGHKTGDIGHAVEEIAKKYNFGFPKNLAGHGVGRAVHEMPNVPNFGSPRTGSLLEEGMVIAIEPMMTLGTGDLYVDRDNFSYRTKDGSRSAHAEHTVMITANGPEILTKE